MEDVAPDFTIDFEILCLNGKSLDTHCDYLNNNIAEFVLDKYESHKGRWYSISRVDVGEVISSKNWDVIIMQEGVIKAMNYKNTYPHVKYITDYISSRNIDVKCAYFLNPGGSRGYTVSGKYYTSDEVWQLDVKTATQLLAQNDVDYVIPCGTGIQNALKTRLDNIGDSGHLSYDKIHLQEGLPCLIEAYVASQSLFDLLSIDASINNSSLRITQQWVNNKNIPGQHGDVIIGTNEDYELCKKSALLAVENPYEISIIP
jgi:hypothetical protein